MVYSIKGRTVLITGASRGLGAVIANRFAAAGAANVVINYASNAVAARKLADTIEAEFPGVKVMLVQADCGVIEEIERMVRDVIKTFGGLDIVIGNAGWTKFCTFGDLDALSEADWDKCWAVNVKGQHALFRASLPTFNANPDGGVFIVTSSIAGQVTGGSSMAYSVTKAAQLHLIRCLAHSQGPKVRVNAVLPGLLLTDWGSQFSAEQIESRKQQAILKDVTDLGDCADMYVSIARNSSMTGQRVTVDAGLSNA